MVIEDEEIIAKLNDIFAKMHDHTVPEENYVVFATKPNFHAIQEHYYFVIGTRLIINPVMLKRKWKHATDQFLELFAETNIDQAECYKTRNEALRAVARNRKGFKGKQINNPHEVKWRDTI